MLIELDLLLYNNQYAEIKFTEKSISIKKIKANLRDPEKEEENKDMTLNTASIKPSISLKSNNQESIALAYNPIYHAPIKQIDI